MKTFALLVGLNNYKDTGISTLGGCVNDINRFEQYLLSTLKVPPTQIVKLLDNQATKAAIVTNFQTHFATATADDVCIFYFAGHGVLQAVHPAFKSDSLNDASECITCYDTKFDGTGLISDKEQRWLIHKLATKSNGCHILTLFDSCHSGDNTRSVDGPAKKSDDKERMIRFDDGTKDRGGTLFPQRPWKEFIFAGDTSITEKKIADNAAAKNPLDVVFPQGTHIQMAACGSNETAKERNGHGHFSRFLMDLLESSDGKLTYYDLRNLIHRKIIGVLVPEKQQTPQFYAQGTTIFQPFLGGATQTSVEATVSFREDKNRWEMSMGSIYGIYKGATVFVTLPHKNNEVEAAIVEQVFHDCSILTFDIEDIESKKGVLDEKKRIRRTDNYKAATGKFMQQALKVACAAPTIATNWNSYTKKNAAVLENASLKVVSSPAQADYVLNTEGSKIFIARPDAPARPLVELLDGAGTDAAFEKIMKQLAAASRWEFVKNQKSEAAAGPLLDYLSFNFTFKGKTSDLRKVDKVSCPMSKFTYRPDYELNLWDELLSVQIVNNHPTDTLYISGIWLSEVFGIETKIFQKSPIAKPVAPSKSINVFNTTFNLYFGNYIFDDKWDKFNNYLKIYVSTLPFEITQLHQLDLQHPRRKVRSGDTERLVMESEETMPTMPQWAVKTVRFEIDVSALK
jgi:hypothetical protein